MISDGRTTPVSFSELMDPTTGKTRVRTVDIGAETFQVARRYMTRLTAEDFQGEHLARIAAIAKMSPEQFKERFAQQ